MYGEERKDRRTLKLSCFELSVCFIVVCYFCELHSNVTYVCDNLIKRMQNNLSIICPYVRARARMSVRKTRWYNN